MNTFSPSDDAESFITTSEAGRLLGVAQRTIHYWLERGVLKSWKTEGGHRRIPMSSINLLLAKRQVDLQEGDRPRHTVLIVEDDFRLREIYQEVVGNWKLPIHLVLAENGFDGLIQAGLCKPEVIITDLVMPSMDGFQMIKSLHSAQDLHATTIIVVTGLNERQIEEQGGLPRHIRVLHKPASFKQLKELIQERLKLRGRSKADHHEVVPL